MAITPDMRPEGRAAAREPTVVQPGRRPRRRLTTLLVAVAALVCVVTALVWSLTRPDVVLQEDFEGPNAVFVADWQFWDPAEQSTEQDQGWFAESGVLDRRSGKGRTDDAQFRMWTRRTDLRDVRVEFDLRHDGFSGGDAAWRGVNLWLNRTLCTPVPECSAVDDAGGNTGYMLRFFAADGYMVINKKVAGDTREALPEGATSFVQGGTYYVLDKAEWHPEPGRTYRFTGEVVAHDDGSRTIRMSVDGKQVLEVVDDGSIAGPPLTGGRLGFRSDYADVTIDDFTVVR